MSIFVFFVSTGVFFDGPFSLRVSLNSKSDNEIFWKTCEKKVSLSRLYMGKLNNLALGMI